MSDYIWVLLQIQMETKSRKKNLYIAHKKVPISHRKKRNIQFNLYRTVLGITCFGIHFGPQGALKLKALSKKKGARQGGDSFLMCTKFLKMSKASEYAQCFLALCSQLDSKPP